MIRIGSTITILGLWSIAIAIAVMDKMQLEHVELVLPHIKLVGVVYTTIIIQQ